MNFTEKHIIWFDDYLSGNLDAKSSQDFEKTLTEDSLLNDEFKSYKSFCEEIEATLSIELLSTIKDGEKKHFKKVRLRKFIFIGLAVLCLLSILAVILLQKYPNENNNNKHLAGKDTLDKVKTTPNTIAQGINQDKQKIEQSKQQIASDENKKKNTENKVKTPETDLFIQKQYFLDFYPRLKVFYSGDTITIESDKDVNKVVAFEMENKSYIRVDNTLFYQYEDRFLIAEKDTRVAELISKSTGKGKVKLFKIKSFRLSEKSIEMEKTEGNPSEKFFVKGMEVTKDDYERLSEQKILQIKTHFFTLEDLYNLNSN